MDFAPRPGTSRRSRACEGGLFEALGKAVLPARSGESEPAGFEAFAALADAVAEALPGWTAPAPDFNPLPGKWRYALDFRDLPALSVSREGPGCPWPALPGFVTPRSEVLSPATSRKRRAGSAGAFESRCPVPGCRPT